LPRGIKLQAGATYKLGENLLLFAQISADGHNDKIQVLLLHDFNKYIQVRITVYKLQYVVV